MNRKSAEILQMVREYPYKSLAGHHFAPALLLSYLSPDEAKFPNADLILDRPSASEQTLAIPYARAVSPAPAPASVPAFFS
jgi:hypothetical protein